MSTYANIAFTQLFSLSYVPSCLQRQVIFPFLLVHHCPILSYSLEKDISFTVLFHNKRYLPPHP